MQQWQKIKHNHTNHILLPIKDLIKSQPDDMVCN